MNCVDGDLWALHAGSAAPWCVIPTNMGWRKDGTAVMGSGLAKQAAGKFPKLAAIYGDFLHTGYRSGKLVPVNPVGGMFPYEAGRLFLLPTKGLNPVDPYLSWQASSDLGFVATGLLSLAAYVNADPRRQWVIPLVGAGCGQLPTDTVLAVLTGIFKTSHNVTLILPVPRK